MTERIGLWYSVMVYALIISGGANMRFLIPALALWSLIAAGCSSPCSNMQVAVSTMNRKDCSSTDTKYDQSACEQKIGNKCSNQDEQAIQDFVACWNDVPVCKTGDESNWTSMTLACDANLANLSQACRDAL